MLKRFLHQKEEGIKGAKGLGEERKKEPTKPERAGGAGGKVEGLLWRLGIKGDKNCKATRARLEKMVFPRARGGTDFVGPPKSPAV